MKQGSSNRSKGFQSNPICSVTRRPDGFTLLELMVVLAIIAMLLTIAVPAYEDFVTRGKLRSGTEGLSAFHGVLEQSYQDNRDFRVDAVCSIATYSSEYFALTCEASSRTAYTLTATSLTSVGQGNAGDYVYTIDQDGVQRTTRFKGETVAITAWKYK